MHNCTSSGACIYEVNGLVLKVNYHFHNFGCVWDLLLAERYTTHKEVVL